MSAAERLRRAVELVEQARAEIEDGHELAPEWAQPSLGLARAELKLAATRLENAAGVLERAGSGGGT